MEEESKGLDDQSTSSQEAAGREDRASATERQGSAEVALDGAAEGAGRGRKSVKNQDKAEKSEKKAWVAVGAAAYGKLVGELSHLSAKLVHTKAGALGVRLGPDALIDAPYVAVSCMPAGSVPLDYVSDSKIANQHRQMMMAAEGREAERFDRIDPQDRDEAKKAWDLAQSTDQVYGQAGVSMRLRQILLPMAGDENSATDYVSLTPLHSGGLSELIRSRIRAEEAAWRAAFEEAHRRADGHELSEKKSKQAFAQSRAAAAIADPVFIPFGGSKPLNASAFGLAVQQGLFFPAPSSNKAVRAALRLHHSGLGSVKPNWELLKKYADFHRKMRQTRARGTSIGMEERRAEREILTEMVTDVLRKGDQARVKIQEAIGRGIVDALTSPNCDPLQKGLIDKEERTREWAGKLGAAMAKHVDDFLANSGTGAAAINLDDTDRRAMAKIFAEEASR